MKKAKKFWEMTLAELLREQKRMLSENQKSYSEEIFKDIADWIELKADLLCCQRSKKYEKY